MINNLTKQLYSLVKENKKLLLKPDEISRLLAPCMSIKDAADFMFFQGAIRKVPVGGILLEADTASNEEKRHAVEKAISSLRENNISLQQAEIITKMLVIALGWDKDKAKQIEKRGVDMDKIVIGIAVAILAAPLIVVVCKQF